VHEKSNSFSKAQGTIEYLVIIAIVVVIALVVVSILTGFLGTGSEVGEQSSKLSNWSNSLAITQTSVDPDGNYLVRLANNSSDPITIANVQVGDTNVNFSEDLFMGGAQNFVIPSGEGCVEGENATRQVKVTYYSKYGVQKTETYPADTFFDCESYSVNLLASRCPDVGGSTCTLDGTASDANVLSGYTFYSDDPDSKLTGTISTRTPSNSSTLFSSGFYASDFNLSVVDTNLNANNILDSATIFGITGTASAGGVEADYYFNEDKSYFSRTEPVSGQGIVTDSKNGLIWQDGIKGDTCSWFAAGPYCSDLNWADENDWRLPTVYELYTLVDIEYSGSSYFPSAFQTVGSTSEYNMWSSTTVPSGDTWDACVLGTSHGGIGWASKTNDFYGGVRCVRSEN
jgi:hypothetical protein